MVIRSQFLRAFAPVAAYLIKLDTISYNFYNFSGIWGHDIVWSVSVDFCNKVTRFVCFCGRMIDTMIEKSISIFRRVPWFERSFDSF